ncbi:GGDEF domain-containing protein [Alkalibaculum sporogenes]|nr:GGDEF domain-containing protein [Alkalibaculum sporogenes]
MLKVTALMLIVDIFSRFDGSPGTFYVVLNQFGNFMIYFLNPIVPSLWLLYVHCQIFQDEQKTRRWMDILLSINMIYIGILLLSQLFGWFYYIDSNNIYHRGTFFLIPALLSVGLAISAIFLIVVNRKKVDQKYYLPLLAFPIPPLVCTFLQIIFYNIPLILNGLTFSLLIVFFNIQSHSINTDYLTGAYNRKKLETYMKEKISTSTENVTFSAILIDIDKFKSINDTFGHDMGDDALQTSVNLIKTCIRSRDFIARFGGDEFCILLDVTNIKALEATTDRISRCIERHNKVGNRPYKLGFSMGYAVYDYKSNMKVEDFIRYIDTLMYENKRGITIEERKQNYEISY